MATPSISDVKAKGFNFAHSKGWLTDAVARKALAMDAALISTPNTTVPAFLLQYVSPDVIEILTAKQAARKILTEKKVGDWTTANYQYQTEEYTGSTGAYSDYGDGPSSGANTAWNVRDQYIFQTTITYGDLEVDMSAQAKVDLVARKQRGAASIIDIDSNKFYLLGVAGKRIYGMLNDPNLPAAITPNVVSAKTKWTEKMELGQAGTTAVYNDILKLFGQLQSQAGGLIDEQSAMKLLISPTRSVALNQSTDFNISARQMLKSNFPNLEIETVPQLSSMSAGETIILMLPEVMGQQTGELAFGEKIRQGRLVPDLSSFRQKFSASTYGFCMRVPFAFAVMNGI